MDQKKNNQQAPSREQKKIALKKILQYLKDKKKENNEDLHQHLKQDKRNS